MEKKRRGRERSDHSIAKESVAALHDTPDFLMWSRRERGTGIIGDGMRARNLLHSLQVQSRFRAVAPGRRKRKHHHEHSAARKPRPTH